MSTMIQIRNVPEPVHRQIKVRAALAGTSMSEFLLQEIRKILDRPTRAEVLDRVAALPSIELAESAAALVRQERDRR